MKIFVIEDFHVTEENICNFYTVRFDDNDISETQFFFENYDQNGNKYRDDALHIVVLIDEMANGGSKIILRPRDEARALALPPEKLIKEVTLQETGNNLRLYYVELEPNVCVLLGGGIAHNGPLGKPPIAFQEAQIFVKKIIEASNIAYEIKEGQILPLDGEEIIIH